MDKADFEAWILRLLTTPARPREALHTIPVEAAVAFWDREQCPNRADCDSIRQYDCTGCDAVAEWWLKKEGRRD